MGDDEWDGGPRRTKDILFKYRVGDSVKLYYNSDDGRLYIDLSEEEGEFQPLIMWNQMTNESRCALNTFGWNEDDLMPWPMPFSNPIWPTLRPASKRRRRLI